MLAKLLTKASDKLFESSLKDESTVRGVTKAALSGAIEGFGNAAIVIGTVAIINGLTNISKKNNVSEEE